MEKENTKDQYPNRVIVCKRVRFWKQLPPPRTLKSILLMGSSDMGQLEYDGIMLRFVGKKNLIDMTAIKDISEIRAEFTLANFFKFWFIYSIFMLLIFIPVIIAVGAGPVLLGDIVLALLATILFWIILQKQGKWVCINYRIVLSNK